MHVQIACMVCSIDPGTANLLVPLAQATIIATPILLRDQIRRGVRAVRDRGRDGDTPDAGDDDPTDDDALEPSDR